MAKRRWGHAFCAGLTTLGLFFVLGTGHPVAMAQQEILVSAAASLTNAFQEVGKRFEKLHPGVKVIFNFGSSGALFQQMEKGAPVDVFATADQKSMDQAAQRDMVLKETRRDFAQNGLVLIVPKDAKLPVGGLRDLAGPGIARIALGNPETVPAGRYAREALMHAGLWEALGPKRITGETVRQVLDYVRRAEVDAGFVFTTDAGVAKDQVRVVCALEGHSAIRYPAAVVAGSPRRDLALQFLEFLLGEEGQAVLSAYGFGKP